MRGQYEQVSIAQQLPFTIAIDTADKIKDMTYAQTPCLLFEFVYIRFITFTGNYTT